MRSDLTNFECCIQQNASKYGVQSPSALLPKSPFSNQNYLILSWGHGKTTTFIIKQRGVISREWPDEIQFSQATVGV